MFVPKWGFSGSGNLTASSRLSHFSATVAVFGDKLSQKVRQSPNFAVVSRIWRQSHFSSTVWTGLNPSVLYQKASSDIFFRFHFLKAMTMLF